MDFRQLMHDIRRPIRRKLLTLHQRLFPKYWVWEHEENGNSWMRNTRTGWIDEIDFYG